MDKIIEEAKAIYADLDNCIDQLVRSRTAHNTKSEGEALFRMEGLMVGVMQFLAHLQDTCDIVEATPIEPWKDKYGQTYCNLLETDKDITITEESVIKVLVKQRT